MHIGKLSYLRELFVLLECRPNPPESHRNTIMSQVLEATPTVPSAKVKPKYRGVSHCIGAVCAIPATVLLYLHAAPGPLRVGSLMYGLSLITLLGVSGMYHTPMWAKKARAKWRKVDHAAIYILMAGSYAPMLIAIDGHIWEHMYLVVAIGAGIGILKALFWDGVNRFLRALPYLLLGWVAVLLMPAIYTHIGPEPLWLVLVEGFFYTSGAMVYARRKPNPNPRVFGYHEIFHLCVILASVCHYYVVWGLTA